MFYHLKIEEKTIQDYLNSSFLDENVIQIDSQNISIDSHLPVPQKLPP